MMFTRDGDCPREAEVLEAIATNRVSQVRDHLAMCAGCADVAEVAAAFHDEHERATREADLPSAGAVWWRATIRARAQAAHTVSQPITVAQGVAGACAVGLACGLADIAWGAVSSIGRGNALAGVLVRSEELAAGPALMLQHMLPLAVGVAACLVIAPLALYLALGDE